jgi:hypothetical protein
MSQRDLSLLLAEFTSDVVPGIDDKARILRLVLYSKACKTGRQFVTVTAI